MGWFIVLLGFSLVAPSQTQGQHSTGPCSEPRGLTAALVRRVITSFADRGNMSIYWKSESLAVVCGQLKGPSWDRTDHKSRLQEFPVVKRKEVSAKPGPGDSVVVNKAQSSRKAVARTGSLED